MHLVDHFEASRPRLLSLAHRLVGSHHDAEDAVQGAWLRAQAADPADLVNPVAWLTTVTARLCLDQLRARQRRNEIPLGGHELPAELPAEQMAADEAFLRREDVSRALLVVLGELSPRQRVAYVLHDLFAVPFDQVAIVLDGTAGSAKKLASRARTRLRDADPPGPRESGRDAEIIEAFLAAARGGDIARLVTLMAPDVVRTADLALLTDGAQTVVRGATAVAEETRVFMKRIVVATPVFIDGRLGAVIAPGGHPVALIRFRRRDDLIVSIDITPYQRGAALLSVPTAG